MYFELIEDLIFPFEAKIKSISYGYIIIRIITFSFSRSKRRLSFCSFFKSFSACSSNFFYLNKNEFAIRKFILFTSCSISARKFLFSFNTSEIPPSFRCGEGDRV